MVSVPWVTMMPSTSPANSSLARLPSCRKDLLRVALAGVDDIRHQLVGVLFCSEARLIASGCLRRRLGHARLGVERTAARLRRVDAEGFQPVLRGLPRLPELIGDIGFRLASLMLLSFGGKIILSAERCLHRSDR